MAHTDYILSTEKTKNVCIYKKIIYIKPSSRDTNFGFGFFLFFCFFFVNLWLIVTKLFKFLSLIKFFLKQTSISNSNLPAKLDKDARGRRESLDCDLAQPAKFTTFLV